MNNEKNPKNRLAEKIRDVTNILVTVSRDPSVDELAAALGLTFVLEKLNKHATAVFSGRIPPAINFLEPEKTFENNADSLRDFIISLDKEKADRLRYKVDGDLVKVFITPYKTKISEKDLKFEDGDFNVELVIAIGVDRKEDLDEAIAAQGRILHSATIATLNVGLERDVLGTISWQQADGNLSEMVAALAEAMGSKDKSLIDEPIATALLTGVVAATDQFKNEKTSPAVMTLAANLMAKGANQQLIASELSAPAVEGSAATEDTTLELNDSVAAAPAEHATPGEISIGHDEGDSTNSGEVEFSPNATPAADVSQTENDRLNSRRDAFATARGEDALAAAEARLNETNNRRTESSDQPAEASLPPIDDSPASTQTEQPELPPVSAPNDDAARAEAQLDNMVSGRTATNDTLNDLRQSVAEATAGETPSSSQLSHGMPYVSRGDKEIPLNSALAGMNNEPPSVQPFTERAGLSPKDHVMIQPLSNETNAMPAGDQGLPPPPPPPLPMPDQLPPNSFPPPQPTPDPSQSSGVPSAGITASDGHVFPTAQPADDTSLGAVPPLPAIPVDNVKPASPAPVSSDNATTADQFQIPS